MFTDHPHRGAPRQDVDDLAIGTWARAQIAAVAADPGRPTKPGLTRDLGRYLQQTHRGVTVQAQQDFARILVALTGRSEVPADGLLEIGRQPLASGIGETECELRIGMSMEGMLSKYVMKCRPGEDQQLWDDASPLTQVRQDAPPFYVVHGTHDTLVWVEEARNFVNRLRGASDQVVAYAELPGAQHAFEVFHSVRTDYTVRSVTAFLEWCYARHHSTET